MSMVWLYGSSSADCPYSCNFNSLCFYMKIGMWRICSQVGLFFGSTYRRELRMAERSEE